MHVYKESTPIYSLQVPLMHFPGFRDKRGKAIETIQVKYLLSCFSMQFNAIFSFIGSWEAACPIAQQTRPVLRAGHRELQLYQPAITWAVVTWARARLAATPGAGLDFRVPILNPAGVPVADHAGAPYWWPMTASTPIRATSGCKWGWPPTANGVPYPVWRPRASRPRPRNRRKVGVASAGIQGVADPTEPADNPEMRRHPPVRVCYSPSDLEWLVPLVLLLQSLVHHHDTERLSWDRAITTEHLHKKIQDKTTSLFALFYCLLA